MDNFWHFLSNFGKFWDFLYQKQEVDFLAVLEVLPDMDLSNKPKMHFLTYTIFVPKPHLGMLQLVTVWQIIQSISALVIFMVDLRPSVLQISHCRIF